MVRRREAKFHRNITFSYKSEGHWWYHYCIWWLLCLGNSTRTTYQTVAARSCLATQRTDTGV